MRKTISHWGMFEYTKRDIVTEKLNVLANKDVNKVLEAHEELSKLELKPYGSTKEV